MQKEMFKYYLMVKIKRKQKDMYSKAKHFGFTDSRVVSCSQELDSLLNKYQKITDANFKLAG